MHSARSIAFNEPLVREWLPEFVVRFVVRVLDTSEQSVSVVPSFGWDTPFDNIVLVVTRLQSDPKRPIEVPAAEQAAYAARINGPPPVVEASWAAIKRSFDGAAM